MWNRINLIFDTKWLSWLIEVVNGQNPPRFVYTHFKSGNQSLDKTPFDFSNIFCAMQSFATSAKSTIILKLPKGVVTWLGSGKRNLGR